ncbi:MAG: hypothetical protein LQ338_003585 [Usnochroma carphineum]|nr:MAG: hypothetical protein LQ338_003585 [Usnochroma carphineum]
MATDRVQSVPLACLVGASRVQSPDAQKRSEHHEGFVKDPAKMLKRDGAELAESVPENSLKSAWTSIPPHTGRGLHLCEGGTIFGFVKAFHDAILIFRPALQMMYKISGFPLMHPWLDEAWPSPGADSGIYIQHPTFGKDPSHLYTQYLIWGINYLLLSMQIMNRYCQTTALLKWQGARVGSIHVSRRPPAGSTWARPNATDVFQPDQGPLAALTWDRLEVRLAYGTRPIAKNLLYLTCVKAMGDAAEKGLTTLLPALFTNGLQETTWKLLGLGGDTIQAGYSRDAAVKCMARIMHDEKFVEIFASVFVDGIEVAIGAYTQGDARIKSRQE